MTVRIEYANVNETERPNRETEEIDDSKWKTLIYADSYQEAVDELVEYLNDADESVDVGVIDHWFRLAPEITT